MACKEETWNALPLLGAIVWQAMRLSLLSNASWHSNAKVVATFEAANLSVNSTSKHRNHRAIWVAPAILQNPGRSARTCALNLVAFASRGPSSSRTVGQEVGTT
eukprot:scaffold670_cov333-Pavlova_lutheri.AAC.3